MDTDFNIPGVAQESTKSWCGEPTFVHRCDTCGDLNILSYSCHKWSCPTCHTDAAGRAGRRVEDRLLNLADAYRKEHVKLGKAKHIVFSISSTNEKYRSPYDGIIQDIKKEAQAHAKRIGILGGASVFHPYRIKPNLHPGIRAKMHELPKKDRRGFWALIRADPLNLGSWKEYVYWSPHVHMIGYMPKILMRSDTFQEATGWVYINLGIRTSVRGTAKYLLTHHAYEQSKQATTYWGCMSYNKAAHTKIKSYEDLKCTAPGCKGTLHRWNCFEIKEDGSPDLTKANDMGIATKTVYAHTYILKRKTVEIDKFAGGET